MEFTITDLSAKGRNPITPISTAEMKNSGNLDDTTFCLSLSEKPRRTAYSKSSYLPSSHDDGCQLVLGLGPAPAFYSKSKESASSISQSWDSDSDCEMLELGLSHGKHLPVPVVDECSTSAKRSAGGYMPSSLFPPRLENFSNSEAMPNRCVQTNLGGNLNANRHCMIDYTAGIVLGSQVRQNTKHQYPKKCMFQGCSKGARGKSKLCIAHGGSQRCQKPGCNKGAESRTAFCKAHGGGKRCQKLGCIKTAEGLCAAPASQQEREAGKRENMIGLGLFHGIVPPSTVGSNADEERSSSSVTSGLNDNYTNTSAKVWEGQLRIPPQVLVPTSMKTSSSRLTLTGIKREDHFKSFEIVAPEGRVHGGSLISLLKGSPTNSAADGME
ncbi:uncharacterized protein LOC109721226 [Ananas comosus]|uniref:Uncharacterized protein LOC109721226 n=1 Tax=Ananas comosus TaxID=4615 RepID=A0A6P5GEE3_ANACO|nr:uncharacterized protein LOC109721226 [Ananas comosus]